MSIDRFGFKATAEAFLDALTSSREVNVIELRSLLSRAYFVGCDDTHEEMSAQLRGKPEPGRKFMRGAVDNIAGRRG